MSLVSLPHANRIKMLQILVYKLMSRVKNPGLEFAKSDPKWKQSVAEFESKTFLTM